MRNLFIIILSLLLVTSVDAQVSVRRTAKKEDSKTTTKDPAKSTVKPRQKQNVDPKSSSTTPQTRTRMGLTDNPEQPTTAKPAGKTETEKTSAAKPTAQTLDSTLLDAGQAAPVKKASSGSAKKATQRKPVAEAETGMSLRRQLFEQNQVMPEQEARWQHIVYRELDLENEVNAALSYPQEPIDGMKNCFQIIFEAFFTGKLKAYEYLDGREVFTDKHLVKIQDVLDTHDIEHKKTESKDGKTVYTIDPADIPSHLVMSYYIKEQWTIDRNSSQCGPQVLAICPVLHNLGDFGSTTRYPLFWIKYEDLRPFIRDQKLMTSGMNTALRYTIDDFFTLAQYDGQIYKVQNPRGLTLMQQYPDSAQLKAKRAEIEQQLQDFRKSVYKQQQAETEEMPTGKRAKMKAETANAKNTSEAAEVKEQSATEETEEQPEKKNRRTKATAKPKTEKQQRSHSVRR